MFLHFLRCVFSNESLNHLPELMQSHIGCICLTFLHCVFSNVSSNCLPEMMHNHTGCICLPFVHCAFSNVFSNGLPQKRHTHSGCICLTFLHCAFSNVFSNGLYEKMQSCTGCIYLTYFSHLHPSNQSHHFHNFAPLPGCPVFCTNGCCKLRYLVSNIYNCFVSLAYFHFFIIERQMVGAETSGKFAIWEKYKYDFV